MHNDAARLDAEVVVRNLTGDKMPTAFPSRRAWLHFVVRDRNGKIVFEGGALNPDGSIQGMTTMRTRRVSNLITGGLIAVMKGDRVQYSVALGQAEGPFKTQ